MYGGTLDFKLELTPHRPTFWFLFLIILKFVFKLSVMANSCLQLSGFLFSCLGWLGIMIATGTNDWVNMCKYGLNTCKKMDELGAKGPWADCVISTGLYHCVSLTQILDLPGKYCSVLFTRNTKLILYM